MNKFLSSFQTDFAKHLILLVSMEFLIFLISGVGYSSISKAPYFNIGVDPLYWVFYGLSIPQTIVKYPIIAFAFDFATIGFLLLSIFTFNEKWIRCTVLLLMLYYITLTGYLGHRNYQSGFVLVLMPLIFKSEKNKMFAFECLRYWILFFYTSSAIFKIGGDGIFNPNHLSSIFTQQLLPYYIEQNMGVRSLINSCLNNFTYITQLIFLGTIIFESTAIIGFFTKKYDRLIGIFLISFHLFSWLLMDISPIGQLSVLSIFFLIPFEEKKSKLIDK
jgi:hypothetical protein